MGYCNNGSKQLKLTFIFYVNFSTDKKLYKTQSDDDDSSDENLTDVDVRKSHKKITFGAESTSRARTG